ncbi:MAG: hypothetical protein M3R55_01900 [Acidobacteriota bacterium]|nr:hypothetical protein [Acidobacteriota bacterium]
MRLPACIFVVMIAAQAAPATHLERMIATERAFAAATREIGIRDGFLTFFTTDAVDIAPNGARLEAVNAAARLRSQPPGPVQPVTQLTWEPRTGAISSARDLGRLTGPYTTNARHSRVRAR